MKRTVELSPAQEKQLARAARSLGVTKAEYLQLILTGASHLTREYPDDVKRKAKP